MKNNILTILLALGCIFSCRQSDASGKEVLKIVIIRHAEKSGNDDNLSCKGFNRSMLLPAVLYRKFGIPNKIYVPKINAGAQTKHLRMLQTVTPLAAKYRIPINTRYDEDGYDDLVNALLHEKGLVIVVWEHNTIPPIVRRLAPAADHLHWDDNDYDSICIISFQRSGKPALSFDSEHINPGDKCNF
jgi:hypothetical protein